MNKNMYITLSLIAIISGIWLFFNNIIFVGTFLCTIPPLIVYLLVYRREYGKWVRYLILPALTFLIIITTPIVAIFESISMSFNPVNSLWRYEGIREDFGTDEYVKHFPKKIHRNAENVKFSFAPQFLQGGGHLILKEELSEADFQKLSASFKETQNKDVVLPDFVFDSSEIKFLISEDIKNYEIIGLHIQPHEKNNWNHGRASGVAMQNTTHSIIYWYEFW